jgi:hypothetical protein
MAKWPMRTKIPSTYIDSTVVLHPMQNGTLERSVTRTLTLAESPAVLYT